jgi:hypothetical protein
MFYLKRCKGTKLFVLHTNNPTFSSIQVKFIYQTCLNFKNFSYFCINKKRRLMVTIANPIYDVVFKYLMEDERIARTILSALLKMEVVKVEVRPHEYVNGKRDTLSVFRIDFGATIRQDNGIEQLILVELQKTWLPTETLRFRQYLGVQYQNPQNVIGEGRQAHALPMVAIYLLGHNVGQIEEPVIYVQHGVSDSNGQQVTKGLPDPFVESLTHDSIIVQIPRLHGRINTRLDKVLSIFDQTYKSKSNEQMMNIDDSLYAGDADMEHIVHRLLMATTDADVRQDMNVEDEYYSIIEKQDTEILMRDRKLAEQKVALDQQNAQLEQQNAQLEQQNAQLEQKDAQLEQKDAQLEQKDALLKSSIQMLLKAGMPIETIAANFGKTAEELRRLMKE